MTICEDFRNLLFCVSLAFVWVKVALAKSETFWCHFEQLVIFNEVDALLKTQLRMRGQLDSTIARFAAHIG